MSPFKEEELGFAAIGIQRIGETLKYPRIAIDKVIAVLIQSVHNDPNVRATNIVRAHLSR